MGAFPATIHKKGTSVFFNHILDFYLTTIERFSYERLDKYIANESSLNKLPASSLKPLNDFMAIDMKTGKNKATSVNGPILLTDIDRYNRTDRSDVDRTAIRSELQKMLSSFLKKSLPKHEKAVKPFDIGDGVGLLFPAGTPKNVLLEKFLSLLPELVKKHNRRAKSATKFLLRASLHFGDYFTHDAKLTKTGFAGKEINHAFRLLESDMLRESVRRQGEKRPVALLLSEDYYSKIVVQQIPHLKPKFVRRIVEVKDGELAGWLYVDTTTLPTDTRRKQGTKKSVVVVSRKAKSLVVHAKQSVILKDLPFSIYVSAADIYNYRLYARIAGSVPLVNHLETGLLLGDSAVVHCTDPYRSQEVFNLLTEYEDFIKSGEILFLLGRSIQSPKHDFIPYINEKSSQYKESGHGKADIASLSQPDPEVDVEGVIKMLEMSPFLLHRGYNGTDLFLKAVRKDFELAEILATTSDPFSGKLQHTNLTLRQILSLAQLGQNGKATPLVADKKQTETIISQLSQKINNGSFSRQILLSLFREGLAGRGRHLAESYFNLLEIRTNLLHLKINVGDHTFTEFHPEREKNSPYDHDHLLDHLSVLGNRAVKRQCGVEMVKALKALPEWKGFATHHLRVMADLYARRLGDLDTETNGFFHHSCNVPAFKKISQVVSKRWK